MIILRVNCLIVACFVTVMKPISLPSPGFPFSVSRRVSGGAKQKTQHARYLAAHTGNPIHPTPLSP